MLYITLVNEALPPLCEKHQRQRMTTTKKAATKRMTQAEVINHFAERFELKRPQAKEIFDELASLAAAEVKNSGEFNLPGFGKLVLAERAAREGRNPATGEAITIPAKTTLKFRLSKTLKESVVPPQKAKK